MAVAKVPSIEVYNLYNKDLIQVLPMDDSLFISDLYTSELLPADIEEKVKGSKGFNKSSLFLDEMIKSALRINNDLNLLKLLSVMKKNKRPHVVELAREMEARINGESYTKPGMIAQLWKSFINSVYTTTCSCRLESSPEYRYVF